MKALPATISVRAFFICRYFTYKLFVSVLINNRFIFVLYYICIFHRNVAAEQFCSVKSNGINSKSSQEKIKKKKNICIYLFLNKIFYLPAMRYSTPVVRCSNVVNSPLLDSSILLQVFSWTSRKVSITFPRQCFSQNTGIYKNYILQFCSAENRSLTSL